MTLDNENQYKQSLKIICEWNIKTDCACMKKSCLTSDFIKIIMVRNLEYTISSNNY